MNDERAQVADQQGNHQKIDSGRRPTQHDQKPCLQRGLRSAIGVLQKG